MRGGVYVYRTRKPGARYNIPVLSRHVGYVGQSNNFRRRHEQHVNGGGEYNSIPKPWADLDPVCYRIGLPDWKWLRLTVEALLIWTLFPVYNVQRNRANPRRITPAEARHHRAVRDRGLHPFNLKPIHGAVAGALLFVAVYLLYHFGGAR